MRGQLTPCSNVGIFELELKQQATNDEETEIIFMLDISHWRWSGASNITEVDFGKLFFEILYNLYCICKALYFHNIFTLSIKMTLKYNTSMTQCKTGFLHVNTWWWEINIHSCYSLVKIAFAPICACKSNRQIWRHNASTPSSRDVTNQLWWHHNAKSESTVPSN